MTGSLHVLVAQTPDNIPNGRVRFFRRVSDSASACSTVEVVMDAYVEVRRVVALKRDEKVGEAIKTWSTVAEWPAWFAKNVVLWRKAHGLPWESCR